jgi:hypothetical protein
MAFTTHSSKKPAPDCWLWLLVALLLCLSQGLARAAETSAPEATSRPSLTLERADGALLLSANFRLELPSVVEDALYKGIPIYFVAQAEVLRDRWYWTKRSVALTQRRLRLAFHPLTRRWRLNVGSAEMTEATQGLTLGQSFDTLDEAMTAARRTSRWKIADTAELDPGSKHLVEFRFALDTSQLPRPLQIGTLGQSDWAIEVQLTQELPAERSK